MMTNLDRNLRTLIVSFVVLVFALVPLRFVEVVQYYESRDNAEVLGVNSEDQVVLPETALQESNCLSADEVKAKVGSVAEIMKGGDLDNRVMSELQAQVEEIANRQCQ